MFNEFENYDKYTHKITAKVPITITGTPRSPFSVLTKDIIMDHHGLETILILIARRFMFHDIENIERVIEVNASNRKKQIALARDAISQWLSPHQLTSFVSSEIQSKSAPNYGVFRGLLETAHQIYDKAVKTHQKKPANKSYLVESEKALNDVNRMIETHEKYYQIFLQPFFTTDMIAYVNKQERSFTLDTVLANALVQGPLTVYTVTFPDNYMMKLQDLPVFRLRSAVSDFKDLVAWYVIERKKNEHIYQTINITDFELFNDHTQFRENYLKILEALSYRELMGEDVGPNFAKRVAFADTMTCDVTISNG